ncbi:MAG: CAP domain-containing protein [Paracoccaceae bacterium]
MIRVLRPFLTLMALAALAACGAPAVGPNGETRGGGLARFYQPTEASQIRLVDGLNALRAAQGVQAVALDRRLTAAAMTHSRDMAVQNRPWHFGSDGSNPLTRAARVGFAGQVIGEAISETYESETETLAAWMQDPGTRAVLLDPQAAALGVGYHQEDQGKIWWTVVAAEAPGAGAPAVAAGPAPGPAAG